MKKTMFTVLALLFVSANAFAITYTDKAKDCLHQIQESHFTTDDVKEFFHSTELSSGNLILKEADHIDPKVSLGEEISQCLFYVHKSMIFQTRSGKSVPAVLEDLFEI